MSKYIVVLTFLFLVACGSAEPNATFPPTVEAISSETVPQISESLSSQLTLIPDHVSVSSQSPHFTIDTQTPVLTGSDDLRVTAFNERLNRLVLSQADAFKNDFQQNTTSFTPNGSYLNVTYQLVSQIAEIWSLKIDFEFYYDGAAHPGHNSVTVNYDLGEGKELTLDDLFVTGSDYLQVISDYCINNLEERYTDDVLFLDGANPTQENYSRWDVASDGLVIIFDEYQVAPYAAGPQSVTVPWSELVEIVNRDVVPSEILP
jgi:hypothetical protein